MKTCSCCLKLNKASGVPPTPLVVLPELTDKRGLTVSVCPTCDGPVATQGVMGSNGTF